MPVLPSNPGYLPIKDMSASFHPFPHEFRLKAGVIPGSLEAKRGILGIKPFEPKRGILDPSPHSPRVVKTVGFSETTQDLLFWVSCLQVLGFFVVLAMVGIAVHRFREAKVKNKSK
jgi:hypothetical protein